VKELISHLAYRVWRDDIRRMDLPFMVNGLPMKKIKGLYF
jgi:hypothetical protein